MSVFPATYNLSPEGQDVTCRLFDKEMGKLKTAARSVSECLGAGGGMRYPNWDFWYDVMLLWVLRAR